MREGVWHIEYGRVVRTGFLRDFCNRQKLLILQFAELADVANWIRPCIYESFVICALTLWNSTITFNPHDSAMSGLIMLLDIGVALIDGVGVWGTSVSFVTFWPNNQPVNWYDSSMTMNVTSRVMTINIGCDSYTLRMSIYHLLILLTAYAL